MSHFLKIPHKLPTVASLMAAFDVKAQLFGRISLLVAVYIRK
jgi:hypothetical protein